MSTTLRKGFTLIEMAVVLVLLGILAALAVPTFSALTGNTQDDAAEAAAQAIITEINNVARAEAALTTVPYINACTGNATPYALCTAADQVTTDTVEGTITATYNPATGNVTVNLPGDQPDVLVTFRGDGFADTITAQ